MQSGAITRRAKMPSLATFCIPAACLAVLLQPSIARMRMRMRMRRKRRQVCFSLRWVLGCFETFADKGLSACALECGFSRQLPGTGALSGSWGVSAE